MRSPAAVACALLIAITSLAFAWGSLAQEDVGSPADVTGSYDLSWWSVDGGGSTFSSGGEYELSGTVGQPDAWRGATAGVYTLSAGFWSCGPPGYSIYLPLVLKQY